MAKILISAGEASGDIHAAAVTAAIKNLIARPRFLVWAATLCASRRRGTVGHQGSWRNGFCGGYPQTA